VNGNGDVGLVEWVAALRAELLRCQDAVDGTDSDLRFVTGPVVLELEVTSGRTAEGKGEVKFWVVGTSGQVQKTRGIKQKITLTLTPETADGAQVRINDRIDERPR
jgi:hypothetical protein